MRVGIKDKLGRPVRDLRISLIDQCNFRCGYCMPKEVFGPDYAFLPESEILTNREVVAIVRAFASLGVKKARLTGGEPLLRKDLVQLVGDIRGVEGIEDVSLTTNGVLLPRYAKGLKDAGISRINVSLDSLDRSVFRLMSGGRGDPQSVIEGIDAALAARISVKVNMVVKRGVNEGEILPMVRRFRDWGIALRFIEFMDVGSTNDWRSEQVFPAHEILKIIGSEFDFEPVDPDYRGEVANRYRYTDIPVEFGLINSISKPFCSDCNRVRLSADGKLYTCLFASEGTDIKGLLRSQPDDQQILDYISKIWLQRADRYSEERVAGKSLSDKVEMSYIGG